jgi:hypothetical protein
MVLTKSHSDSICVGWDRRHIVKGVNFGVTCSQTFSEALQHRIEAAHTVRSRVQQALYWQDPLSGTASFHREPVGAEVSRR